MVAKRQTKKPGKPRRDYPLTPHRNGQWCKKVRGVIYYFGPWDEPELAEKRWDEQKDDLRAGRQPEPKPESVDGIAMRELCNEFMTTKEIQHKSDKLSEEQFRDLFRACERAIDHFGPEAVVNDLRPRDFRPLRENIFDQHKSPTSRRREMTNVRSIFHYGGKNCLHSPVQFGSEFDPPGQAEIRAFKHEKKRRNGGRTLTAEQIQQLLDASARHLAIRAMMLLSCNTGMNNSDLRQLELSDINLETGWLDYPRRKNSVERRGKLWAQTTDAIIEYLRIRKSPSLEKHMNVVFITSLGNPWGHIKNHCISSEFRKLLDKTGIYRPGLSFGSLRHTFQTVASEGLDFKAVGYVMGHADNTIAANYTDSISDDRLEAVAQHVHDWLFGGRK